MELWKYTIVWFVALIAKSFGLLWSLNELFGLEIEYNFISLLASLVLIFCVSGELPSGSQRAARSTVRSEAA